MTGQAIEHVAKLRLFAEEGRTFQEAAQQLDLCYPYIVRLAKQHGIDFSRRQSSDPLVVQIRELASQGHTRHQIAESLNLDYATITRYGRDYEILFKHGNLEAGPTIRTRQMAALYQSGKTLQEIGTQYGITRERVRQIITKFHGLRAPDGGQHKQALDKRDKFEAKRNARSLKHWGCNFDQYRTIRDMKKPTRAYATQRRNAFSRGIGWELNLWQWWSIWQQSGKWSQRGRGQGYMMCRKGDLGPYAIDNVFIATGCENSSNQRRKKSGLPTGVSKNKRCAGYFAQRSINGKTLRLGSHPTPELAHAAYLSAGADQ